MVTDAITSKVRLSNYACAITWIINVVLIVCCVLTSGETLGFWSVGSILICLLIVGLLFGPTRIIADYDYVIVKSRFLKYRIAVSDIESVELFQPGKAAYRLCASGGYFGYWGLFREKDVGKYVGYFGNISDCFLIKTKNGDKYVLGCNNPAEMVTYIHSLIM